MGHIGPPQKPRGLEARMCRVTAIYKLQVAVIYFPVTSQNCQQKWLTTPMLFQEGKNINMLGLTISLNEVVVAVVSGIGL